VKIFGSDHMSQLTLLRVALLVCASSSGLPAQGTRALVVVLHGGLGNAQRIESKQSENGLNMDVVAEKSGFI
jgi:poly(3-hydroxybutyrate) depolymerase